MIGCGSWLYIGQRSWISFRPAVDPIGDPQMVCLGAGHGDETVAGSHVPRSAVSVSPTCWVTVIVGRVRLSTAGRTTALVASDLATPLS